MKGRWEGEEEGGSKTLGRVLKAYYTIGKEKMGKGEENGGLKY